MYLQTRFTPKNLALFALFIFLLLVPFRPVVKHFFIFFSRGLMISPQQISQKITSLEKKQLFLSLKLNELRQFQDENEKLKKALDFKQNQNVELIAGSVISFDPSSWRRIIVINAGKDKNVTVGMFALDQDGWLVGKVTEVRENFSRIVLVDDPTFSLPVFIGTGSYGLLKGGLHETKIMYIENEEQINAKDKVWFRHPNLSAPIYIGDVRSVRQTKQALFQDIQIRLFSQNPVLNKIFLIK